jgi:hypothetical protein
LDEMAATWKPPEFGRRSGELTWPKVGFKRGSEIINRIPAVGQSAMLAGRWVNV